MVRRTAFAIALAALVASGCQKLDCFDGGALEAAYVEGQQSAAERNAAEFDRGRRDGLALTAEDGRRDGQRDGYEAGFDDGYYGPGGYAGGYNQGYDDGHDDGVADPAACEDGADLGAADGDADGFATGDADGYDVGFGDGYDAGFGDAIASCPAARLTGVTAAAPVDEGDQRTCFDRGYRQTLDARAYDRGLAEGKRDNPDYQRGYAEAYPPAFAAGRSDGAIAGYNDGYDAGYDAGYDEGYEAVFADCYDAAYTDAFDGGYSDGYDDGYDDGYGEGYDDGYDDGARRLFLGVDSRQSTVRPERSRHCRLSTVDCGAAA
jgi:flagellar biosynthesis/type III secretory pathway protein FliH